MQFSRLRITCITDYISSSLFNTLPSPPPQLTFKQAEKSLRYKILYYPVFWEDRYSEEQIQETNPDDRDKAAFLKIYIHMHGSQRTEYTGKVSLGII